MYMILTTSETEEKKVNLVNSLRRRIWGKKTGVLFLPSLVDRHMKRQRLGGQRWWKSFTIFVPGISSKLRKNLKRQRLDDKEELQKISLKIHNKTKISEEF